MNTLTNSSSVTECDYLIVGAGACGLAFADILLTETDASICIVDKHHKPGGHWNDAYPFVTLHQPSAFYGVSSKELSRGKLSQYGYNKGLNELASGAEVLHYFEELMLDRFLPSGRVSYFPMCEYKGGGQFVSLLSGQVHETQVKQRVVDSTFFGTSVPSTHTRPYSVAEAAHCIALSELPKLDRPYANYVVIGAGKTGIDAVLWLLENQVNADNITWVMPRDSWLINRRNTQPGIKFFDDSIGAQAKQMEILAKVNTIPELFAELEKAKILLRIDPAVTPGIFHGATVSEAELTELRRVKNILRHGRVQHVDSSELVFADTTVKVGDDAIFIDCSAIAVTARPPEPVFTDERIMIQTVRSYQPVFSAAFIAHIEASYAEDQHKNELCQVVPLPDRAGDWLRCTAAQMMNQYRWSQEPGLRDWLVENRLDGFSALLKQAEIEGGERKETVYRMRQNAGAAVANIQKLLATLPNNT